MLAAAALLASAASSSAAAREPARPATRPGTLPLEQVHAGQRAVVRTVFEGFAVDTFSAEIVGVIRGGRAEGDIILARATSDRVVRTGIAQGMSGSPVYVDGKMIGALSSGWQFEKEPLFGVTPIGEMLAVLDHPSRDTGAESAGPSGVEMSAGQAPARFGEFRWNEDPDDPTPGALDSGPPATPVTATATALAPLAIPVACSGLAGPALAFVRDALQRFGLSATPGGAAGGDGGPTRLEPGSAVAVDLLRGDLQFSAIGTASWIEGDRILAFGHPFFQSGDVRLPLATAEIVGIVPSTAISFKVGMRGRTIGAIQQDRRAAIAGRLGATAHMLPFAVAIRGAQPEPQRFRFETVEDRNLAPLLISVATLNSMLESGGSGGNQTLRWTLTLRRRGAAPLSLSDVVAGDEPPNDLANAILAPVRFLYANPYGALELDSLGIAIDVTPGREQWTLRSARVLSGPVRPGSRIRVQCDLARWRGGSETRVFTVDVPEELPNGRYGLWIGGGPELMRYEAQRLPGLYRPESLADAWQRLARSRSSDALYLVLFARAPEVTTGGRDYPELPDSAVPLLSSESASGESRRGDLARFGEQRIAFRGPLRGELLLPIDVDASAP